MVASTRPAIRLEHALETTNELVTNTSALFGKLLGAPEGGAASPMGRVAGRLDATIARAVGYLIVLGATWSLLWWSGYAFAKRRGEA
jgi:hypothetical protein